MRLAILTYPVPHLKTQELLFRLWRRGFRDIRLVLTPFKQRAARNISFQHRPDQFTGPSAQPLADAYGLPVTPFEQWETLIDKTDYFLVSGAGLLDGRFCAAARVLNSHPGLVPQARGLDAFKWAIWRGEPIGNTLHFIDADVDMGEIVHHEPTPVFAEDDIHSLAKRHYEAEIDVLANFDQYLPGGARKPLLLDLPVQPPRMRMPADVEAEMLKKFETYAANLSTKGALT